MSVRSLASLAVARDTTPPGKPAGGGEGHRVGIGHIGFGQQGDVHRRGKTGAKAQGAAVSVNAADVFGKDDGNDRQNGTKLP